ncbi:MAG: hypothetical protein N4A44_03320 [Alphaproteobacteria bacterium]|jgi:hypothetical protein|nr:hypothetical protein [Alphaproteobacteria bacterium]
MAKKETSILEKRFKFVLDDFKLALRREDKKTVVEIFETIFKRDIESDSCAEEVWELLKCMEEHFKETPNKIRFFESNAISFCWWISKHKADYLKEQTNKFWKYL